MTTTHSIIMRNIHTLLNMLLTMRMRSGKARMKTGNLLWLKRKSFRKHGLRFTKYTYCLDVNSITHIIARLEVSKGSRHRTNMGYIFDTHESLLQTYRVPYHSQLRIPCNSPGKVERHFQLSVIE